jgi:hypothetical protein
MNRIVQTDTYEDLASKKPPGPVIWIKRLVGSVEEGWDFARLDLDCCILDAIHECSTVEL